ncbi:MAG: hypothetical protein IT567_04550 [Alphaproteobacteria bacterium]|nr:hypothetical protein [Alphaproteobacteria bacterium]
MKSAPPLSRLHGADLTGGNTLDKAGILPFRYTPERELEFFFVLPEEKHPAFGPQQFQIAKGTRKVFDAGGLRDMGPMESVDTSIAVETLAATALREGAEEIGLHESMVTRLIDAGKFAFQSQKDMALGGSGAKTLRIFLAEIRSPADLEASHPTLDHSQDRKWLKPDDPRLRPDHREIAQKLAAMLGKNSGKSL